MQHAHPSRRPMPGVAAQPEGRPTQPDCLTAPSIGTRSAGGPSLAACTSRVFNSLLGSAQNHTLLTVRTSSATSAAHRTGIRDSSNIRIINSKHHQIYCSLRFAFSAAQGRQGRVVPSAGRGLPALGGQAAFRGGVPGRSRYSKTLSSRLVLRSFRQSSRQRFSSSLILIIGSRRPMRSNESMSK